MTAQELGPLQQNLPYNAVVFGFNDGISSQAIMGYLVPYATRSEQVAFDGMLPKMVDYLASAFGASAPPERLSGLNDVGESRLASTFVNDRANFPLRYDILLFRRGETGAFLFIVYPDGDEPAMPAGDLARILDERLGKSFGATGCVKSDSPAASQGLSGKVAFVSDRDGNPEIYVINADGSGERRVTNNPGNDYAPAWSPDGKHIAFYSERDGNAEIYVMNSDGSSVTRLTDNPANDYAPAWSPDGKRIAFHSHRYLGHGRIFVMNADGSEVTRLTDPSFDDWSPAWSPDGKQIVFNSSRGPKLDIWLMNADGTGMTNLTAYPADDWWPDWSPDGKQIVFHSIRDGNFEIYAINIDGSGVTRLTDYPASDYDPAWSPDGSRIAFTSDRCGDREIWIIKADGSEATDLTRHPGNDWAPAWYGPRPKPEQVVPTTTPAGWDPLVGTWVAVDPRDRSNETLTITREGDGYSVVLVDDGASLCGLDEAGKPKFAAEIKATGTAHGAVLNTISSSVKCMSTPPSPVERVFWIDYSYQEDSDTLRDNVDFTIWRRP